MSLPNLPHDHGAEAAILDCIMRKPELIRRCDIELEVFHSPFYRRVFRAMLDLDADCLAPDAVLVISKILEQDGDHRVVEITRIQESGAVIDVFGGYIERVRRLAYQRAVLGIDEEHFLLAQEPEWRADEAEEARERKLREARQRFWPAEQAMEPIPAEDRSRAFHQRMEDWTTATGWDSVDEITGQIYPASVVTVLGRSGVGKSALGLNLCANWLRVPAEWGILFASLEMEDTLATDRLIQIVEGWTQTELVHAMRSGTIPTRYRALTERRYCLFSQAGQPLSALERSIDLWQKQHGRRMRALVIDYFQYLAGQKGESPYEKSSRLSRQIKELAKNKEILIVNLCQVSRGEAGGKGTACPSLEGGRDSGTIEENADVVIGIWRPAETGMLMLKVLKARQGRPGGTAELSFSPGNLRLCDAKPNLQAVK